MRMLTKTNFSCVCNFVSFLNKKTLISSNKMSTTSDKLYTAFKSKYLLWFANENVDFRQPVSSPDKHNLTW